MTTELTQSVANVIELDSMFARKSSIYMDRAVFQPSQPSPRDDLHRFAVLLQLLHTFAQFKLDIRANLEYKTNFTIIDGYDIESICNGIYSNHSDILYQLYSSF